MQSTAGYYGHVAVVERVYKSGSIKISEYNYNVPLGYGTRIISKSSARHYNYIYYMYKAIKQVSIHIYDYIWRTYPFDGF